LAALGGLAAGLGLAPLADPGGALAAVAVTALFAVLAWRSGILAPAAIALAFGAGGLAVGDARLAAIDAGALETAPGSPIEVRGHLTAPPRRDDEAVRLPLSTPSGRLLVETAYPPPDVSAGDEVAVAGRAARAPPWLRDDLRADGIATVLEARRLTPTGGRRGGLPGLVDTLRRRSERALEEGMPSREAALARGFVLGQDDRIDSRTVEDFRRSGLAHLLAVSGQNVALLALLATPFLALLGLSLRGRVICTGALIAVYVPLAGGGPSIQRAGVMGIAALLAVAAGRPSSRLYALLLAAAATLALNPRAGADVGWQLSFAAVAGILLISGPMSRRLAGHLGRGAWQKALADGVAMSVAATVATTPLVAHHFGTVPVASLPANLVALPAVAPAMWLGMLAAAAGQVPGLPVGPINDLNAILLAYIAQVAEWFGDPGWATARVALESPAALAAAYAALAALCLGAGRLVLRRRPRRGRPGGPALAGTAVALGLLALAVPALLPAAGAPAGRRPGTLRVTVFDVGQGDAILLEPPRSLPVLVDTGPAEADAGRRLRDAGVENLAAVVLSHEQADHAGGLPGIAAEVGVRRFVFARASAAARASIGVAGAAPDRVAAGRTLRFGRLSLEVLWPPPELAAAAGPSGDPNSRSLVLLARWRSFEMLLTGDAEAELAPVDPGPVDVLKVAHHGSADPGLEELLRRVRPRVAVISVGENPYGHPAPETLGDLGEAGVPALRTDLGGDVVLEVAGDRLRIANN
jgi:competence protein ComEC